MANWRRSFFELYPEKAAWPIVKSAKHSLHLRRPDGVIEANFTGAPQAAESVPGSGHFDIDLNTALVYNSATGDYGAPGLRPRLKLDRTNTVGVYSQRTMRVGLFDTSTMSFASKVTLPAGHVEDDCIVSGGSWWEHRIRLTETGLRETLTIQSKQTIAGAKAADWLVLDTIITGRTFADGEITAEDEAEGYRFPLPRTWDSSGGMEPAPCKRWAKTISGVQHVFTGIPLSWLATAVYPVVVDPDYADSANDGYIYGLSGTWATARSTYTSADNTFEGLNSDSFLSGGTYYNFRSQLWFDTSTIGAGATVTQVNLAMTVRSKTGSPTYDVQIIKHNGSITWNDANYDALLSDPLDNDIWQNTTSLNAGSRYSSGNLSTGWVKKTATTYYGLRNSTYDSNNSAPGGLNVLDTYSQNRTTAGDRPVLTVLYHMEYTSSLAGALTLSGVILKMAGKPLAGSLASSGTVTKSAGKPLAGALPSSGALAKAIGKSLAGALTSAGTALKATTRSLAGALTSSALLARLTGKPLVGSLTSSGVVSKSTGKGLAGVLASSGVLLRATAKGLAGALTSSGTLVKRTARSLAGALGPSGMLTKRITKALAGALASSGALVKSTGKTLSGALASIGSLISTFIAGGGGATFTKALAGALTFAGTVSKQTAKGFAGTLALSGTIRKSIGKRLSGLLSWVGTLLGVGHILTRLVISDTVVTALALTDA